MCTITIKNLTASYSKDTDILKIPNLTIGESEETVYGIFGRNHVGKTTLLRILAQVIRKIILSKDTEILYDNSPYDPKSLNFQISYVPQKYVESLLPWYTINKNLALPLLAKKKSKEFIDHQINTICNELGYENKETFFRHFGYYENDNSSKSKMPMELSGGQQQVLVLLRSLIPDPSVLIMDEPFSALDIYRGADFRLNLLNYVERKKLTTIFVSHDLEETIDMAHKIIFLQPIKGDTSIAEIEKVGKVRLGPNLEKSEAKKFIKAMEKKHLSNK